ncbi:MAG: ThiF family adenylyltransferase [Candidatus Omnitrophica bacterium]|nr:ThiF family adenylyltransferase [Candidatus Omnitrophota bacterium]
MDWSYEEAFRRNRGLIRPEEQQRLRSCRVAIAGMGGVGGIHLVTLARLGIGRFSIADPDRFEVANFNRQQGATRSTLGRLKVEVLAEMAREINPGIDLRIFTDPIGPDNAEQFLKEADLFIDGIDAFEIEARRLLFRAAAARGIYAVTAGPLGFSTAWIVFDPGGMSFDRYFDLSDGMDETGQFVAFIIGLAPAATHRAYLDRSAVDVKAHTGPSASLACQLAAGAAAAETLKILLHRGSVRPAPFYQQFDPYLGRWIQGKLLGGNRHPLQRLKRWLLVRQFRQNSKTASE